MSVDRDRIREVYLAKYAETGSSADAWNAVIRTLAPFASDEPETATRRRREIMDALMDMQDDILREAGDPLAEAVDEAMSQIRALAVVPEARAQWRRILADSAGKTKGRRRQDWAPGAKETEEDAVERMPEHPNLYLLFDNAGEFISWRVDWPDYFTSGAGIVASVPLSDSLDYDAIERAIADELAMADIEWPEKEEE